MGLRRGSPTHLLALCCASALLALAGCGTGNRLDTDGDGPGGGQFLPIVHQADSGVITLVDGKYEGAGNDLILSDPFSLTSFRLFDQNVLSTGDQIFDTDGDGDIDYIILVIRALAAHAAASVTALDQSSIAVDPREFIKVGGAAFEPLDTEFSLDVEITMPINPSVGVDTGDVLQIFKFRDNFVPSTASEAGRDTSDDIGTGTGTWLFVQNVTVEEGPLVRFEPGSFGQYCAVATEIVHDQGSGGDV